MKTTCNVIQDLLPLYCDDACSAESRRLVEEHLKECDDCRETYQLMQAALPAKAAHTQQQATAQAAQAWKKQGSTSFFKGCLVVLASAITSPVVLSTSCARTFSGRSASARNSLERPLRRILCAAARTAAIGTPMR